MAFMTGDAELTWLGHSTWLLKSQGGKRVLFDPFIGDNPMCPDEYKNDALDDVDLILVTHGHLDHVADLVTIAKRSAAQVVGIFDLTTWLESKGVENTSGMNKGGSQRIGDLTVRLVDAVHSSALMDDGNLVDVGDPCGIVMTLEDGYTIYNAGDTAVFGDMSLIAELYRPDLTILPIGDHFTMGPREAAKAVELLGARLVVPQHFGTFPVLTGTPEAFQALVPDDVQVVVLEPGQTLL